MATREQIEALKIDENVIELVENTVLEYLVQFATLLQILPLKFRSFSAERFIL